ncbi:uncharacterized protein [Choristoneura fumiferana]|uniref:uncharacterized protein n=1 Tax=Choristoneura fumiferana TaxID=7141 RepID=UPI003D155763
MKPYTLALCAAVLLHLFLETQSQFPHPPGPYPQPRSMQSMPMPPMGMPGMPMPPMPPMGMPGMPMGLPMNMMQQQRMPVVVMPYHSKTADSFVRKKRPRRRRQRIRVRDSESTSSSDSDSRSTSSSSSSEMDFRGSKKKRHQVLTPVVSYVTKDGYVIYQKKIKKDRAKDWLDMEKGRPDTQAEKSEEMTLRQLKKKYGSKKKKHRRERRGD